MWIETSKGSEKKRANRVTPHVGVWIETDTCAILVLEMYVTPHVGVWIETSKVSAKNVNY